MVEERKGHVKMTVEVEINEPLMELIAENMKNIPQMVQSFQRRGEGKGNTRETGSTSETPER